MGIILIYCISKLILLLFKYCTVLVFTFQDSANFPEKDKLSSKDEMKKDRNEAKAQLSDDDYSEREPPIQFAIFLIVLAVLFTILALCINYARTSGWFDNLGKR